MRGAQVLAGALILVASAQAAECQGLPQPLQALSTGVWLADGQLGESNPDNRGRVSSVLLVAEGSRLWALGSGPSPAAGRALACQVRRQLGRRITDVISPWARPELVLGVKGLGTEPAVRHWAHESVGRAMAEQCPHCVERLAQRLGSAADDLGPSPIPAAQHLLQGEQGRLGPLQWWRLPRSEGRWVTVWRVDAAAGEPVWWVAHGLMSGPLPPDGRDGDLRLIQASARQLAALAAADGPRARWLGEQGPPQPQVAARQLADYWDQLLQTVVQAINEGADETAAPRAWPGLPTGWASHAWHAFNWQRAWRQEEARLMGAEPAAPVRP